MRKKYKEEFNKITKEIIDNDYFKKMKNDVHHGTSKYEHLIRVSKCSFILGKIFKADINSVTRAGLLHDFFFGTRKSNQENSYLNHPKTAAKNAKMYFNINKIEEEAIKSHMYHHVLIKKIFPFINRHEKAKIKDYKPKSKEGWIICISDLLVSIFEYKYECSYITSLTFLVLLNIIEIKL